MPRIKIRFLKLLTHPCGIFFIYCDTHHDQNKQSVLWLRISAFVLQSNNGSKQKTISDSLCFLHRRNWGNNPDDLSDSRVDVALMKLTIVMHHLVGILVQVSLPLCPGKPCLFLTSLAEITPKHIL